MEVKFEKRYILDPESIERYDIKTSTPVHKVKLGTSDEMLKKYSDEVYRIIDPNNSGTFTIRGGGKMSTYEIYKDSSLFNELFDKILHICDNLREFAHQTHSMHMPEAWGVIFKKGSYAIRHTHHPAPYSFVYYLNDCDISTPIVFDRSEPLFKHYPKKDEMLFFPGNMVHSVEKHLGNTDRLILAGNFALDFKATQDSIYLKNK